MEKSIKYWKAKDGRKIAMSEMDNDHLQKALIITQRREYELWEKQKIFIDLRNAIEEEAEIRNLKLLDIDQLEENNSKYGNYFGARSKRKKMLN